MEPNDITFRPSKSEPEVVMRWTEDGRVFWRGREVETDDELRAMMRDLYATLTASVPLVEHF